MNISILAVGRLKDGPEKELFERYRSRFVATGRGLGLVGLEVVEMPESRAVDAAHRKRQEAAEILRRWSASAPYFVLDERGRQESSVKFAERLSKLREDNHRRIGIVIGGPDGLDRELIENAAASLSLSRMTLTHGLARLLLMEQLYRAATILSGHPYHRA